MRKASTLGVVSAGLLLAGSPVHAVETSMSTSLNVGIANGIQANLPVQAPVNFCGNAIGLLGTATASCVGGAKANFASGGSSHGYGGGGGSTGGQTTMSSFLNPGIANGIQVSGLVQAPVNICGNAIGILGTASASCVKSGATANAYSAGHQTMRPHRPMPYSTPTPPRALAPRPAVVNKALPSTIRSVAVPRKKEAGLLAGVLAPVTSLLGMGGDAKTNVARNGGGGGGKCGDVSMKSFGNIGIANGIQAHAPIQVPINFAGNAIGILGGATASSVGGAAANYCS